MKINPPPTSMMIFSGGGALMERVQIVHLSPGINKLDVENVPASFDPSTTTAFLPDGDEGVTILQVDVKRPDKQIVENFINREKTAASNIISQATDLRGTNREKIIQLIESAHYRRYEDMEGSVTITVDSVDEKDVAMGIRYFLEDTRLKWTPSVHVKLDEEKGLASIECFILAMNNTDISFPATEVQFAEFEMESTVGDEGYLFDLETEQVAQAVMPKNRMLRQFKRMKSLLK